MNQTAPAAVNRREYVQELIARMEAMRPVRKLTRSPLYTAWKTGHEGKRREADEAREAFLQRHRERRRAGGGVDIG